MQHIIIIIASFVSLGIVFFVEGTMYKKFPSIEEILSLQISLDVDYLNSSDPNKLRKNALLEILRVRRGIKYSILILLGSLMILAMMLLNHFVVMSVNISAFGIGGVFILSYALIRITDHMVVKIWVLVLIVISAILTMHEVEKMIMGLDLTAFVYIYSMGLMVLLVGLRIASDPRYS